MEEHARIRKEQEEFLQLEREMREEAEREEKRRLAAMEIYRFQDRVNSLLIQYHKIFYSRIMDHIC